MSSSTVNLDELTVNTTVELLWPPSGQWQTGTITHVWGNGEFAIQFEDDPFDEPLSYRLESYQFRIITKQTKQQYQHQQQVEHQQQQESIHDIEMKQEDDDEVEAVIDNVYNDNDEYGAIFNVYRIKWKGYGLSEATWEPKQHLIDASDLIEKYNGQITTCNPNTGNIRKVRKSPFDNNLLQDLWCILTENGNNSDNEYGVIWTSEGRAFQIINCDYFISNFLSRNKHNIIDETNYNSFSDRMSVLGFEQQKENKSYHHPCFNNKSNKLIEYIGKNSIPLNYTEIAENNHKNGCRVCGNTKVDLMRCSQCKSMFYCSREHQVTDWERHSKECEPPINDVNIDVNRNNFDLKSNSHETIKDDENVKVNYLSLDDYMISLDDKSLNKLSTAQLMQRLRSHGLDYKGLKHQLIERWKKYKLSQQK